MSDPDIICLSSDDDLPGPSNKTFHGNKTPGTVEMKPAIETSKTVDTQSSLVVKTSLERGKNSAIKIPETKKTMKVTQLFPKQGNCGHLLNSSLPTKAIPEARKTDIPIGFSRDKDVLEVEVIPSQDDSPKASPKPPPVKTPKAKKTMKVTQLFPKQGNCGNLPNSSLPAKAIPEARKTDIPIGFSRDKDILEVEEIPSQDESPEASPKPPPVNFTHSQPSTSDNVIEAPADKEAPEIVSVPSEAEIAEKVDDKACAIHIPETKTENTSDPKCTNSGPFTIIHTANFDAKPVGTSLVDLFIAAIQPGLKKDDLFVIEKLRKHTSAANPESLATMEFNSAIQTLIKNVNQDPSNVFVYSKKLLDLLKSRRSVPKTLTTASAPCKEEKTDLPAQGDDNGARTERRIVKLERFLAKLSKKIQEFSVKEVDLEDDSSAFVIEARLKERFMKVAKKICELKDAVLDAERIIDVKIKYQNTRYPEINKAITRLLRKGPDMPDYHDVLATVKKANEIHSIHLGERMIEDLARRIFESIGSEFQTRRKKDLSLTMQTYTPEDVDAEDPADKDPELLRKLIENRKTFKKEENEVIAKYAEKQVELKEEPQEVVDGEEEITSEGDEDEDSDSVVELEISDEDRDEEENEEEDKSSANTSQSTLGKSHANSYNGNHDKSSQKRRASTSEKDDTGRTLKVPKLCISD